MAEGRGERARLADEELPGLVVGSGRGGSYDVAVGDELLACTLRGRLKLATGGRLDQLAVGDEVLCRRSLDEPERGVIEAVLPRRSQLGRGRPGKPPQIIAANLNQVMVVVAVAEPDLSLHAVDRFLAIAAAADLPAHLVLNKGDLDPTGEIAELVAEIYEPLAIDVLATSVLTGDGLSEFDQALAGRVSVVIGPSGAGKSSLLNAVNPGYQLRTGEVMSIGKGRHTTTSSRLLPLDHGGYVADTPGIKTLQLIEGAVEPKNLQHLFPEIGSRAADCRFADCTHRAEPDCAVQEAVECGEVAPSRYDSYVVLYGELEAVSRPW